MLGLLASKSPHFSLQPEKGSIGPLLWLLRVHRTPAVAFGGPVDPFRGFVFSSGPIFRRFESWRHRDPQSVPPTYSGKLHAA